MKITCKSCGYTAEIPQNMSPSMYCEWHNWTLPVEANPSGGVSSYCSQCHARVGARE